MKDITKALKMMMASKDYTFQQLADEYNARTGSSFTRQAFSYKMRNGALRASEFLVVCEILGYNLILEERDTHVRVSF